MKFVAPWGTMDTLPDEMRMRRYVEGVFSQQCRVFGYNEIHTPVFEYGSLFRAGVGHVTDIVENELYTFSDKNNEKLALRPEGTASVARAVLQHGLFKELPQKLCYRITCYRHEDPEEGRLREFHQIGAECYGGRGPEADCEVISLAYSTLKAMGLKKLTLNINSVGCKECRVSYINALVHYLLPFANDGSLCPTCVSRLGKNPLRVMDCKNPNCKKIAANAPFPPDYLCGDCREHFEELQNQLKAVGIEYNLKPRLIRGLDYYSRTVFEFKAGEGGAKGTVCGGGRYDSLLKRIGADFSVPAVGFAIGEERTIIALRTEGIEEIPEETPKAYVISAEPTLAAKGAAMLREKGIFAKTNLMGAGIEAQEEEARASGALWRVYVSDDKLRFVSADKEYIFKSDNWAEAIRTIF